MSVTRHRTAARRCLRALTASGAALAVVAATGGPAAAASPDVVGGAVGSALTLTVNLPGGEATRIVLQLDPVTGTVSGVSATGKKATSSATVLRGSLGGQALDSGTSSAMLPSPTSAQSNPSSAIADGLAGTPLVNLLKLELLPSKAEVSTAPSSTGTAAVSNIGVGLPDALASALAPLTGPLSGAIGTLLTTLADTSGTPVAALCSGAQAATDALTPVTDQLGPVLAALPITIPVQEAINGTTVMAICGLSTTIAQLNAALQDALASLTGDSGVLGTGLVTSTQSITRKSDTVTSVASSSIAGLTLLGQTPFASAQVLKTTSTAITGGTAGSAKASVESTIADLTGGTVDPFLQVRTTIQGIQNSFVGAGVLPDALKTLFDDLFATLNAALAPVGVTVFKLDDSAGTKDLTGCPTALDGLLSGTFTDKTGACAAAATRGVGISLSLPEALATPLGVAGPLVELQIVPTSAVAQAQIVTTAAAPPTVVPTPTSLPRTGSDSALLGGLGVLLLVGAVTLRRRRSIEDLTTA